MGYILQFFALFSPCDFAIVVCNHSKIFLLDDITLLIILSVPSRYLFPLQISPSKRATAQEAQKHPWLQQTGTGSGSGTMHFVGSNRVAEKSCAKAEEKSDQKKCRRLDIRCKSEKAGSEEIGTDALNSKVSSISHDSGKDVNSGEEKSSNLARHMGSKQTGGCKGEY